MNEKPLIELDARQEHMARAVLFLVGGIPFKRDRTRKDIKIGVCSNCGRHTQISKKTGLCISTHLPGDDLLMSQQMFRIKVGHEKVKNTYCQRRYARKHPESRTLLRILGVKV